MVRTREWWDTELRQSDAFVSENIVLELAQGDWPGKKEALRLVEELPRLSIGDEVIAVATQHIKERLLPDDLAADATHLAVASIHKVDFLLTWNIRHLANPNKLDHLMHVNRKLGLPTPRVLTPEALWSE